MDVPPVAHYLVTAKPRPGLLDDLERRLAADEFVPLRPFGKALSSTLREARRRPDGAAVWEEEDYCRPPLAQERAAVLDRYFGDLTTERVERGAGWKAIAELPPLFPGLRGR